MIDLDAAEYGGGFSTLTRYGTMLTSTSRIPRKKRGKGNAALYRARLRCLGYAPTPEGIALAEQGICSVLVHKPGQPSVTVPHSAFRKDRAPSTRTAHESAPATLPESARLPSIHEGIYS
jgi:hypothetical protein